MNYKTIKLLNIKSADDEAKAVLNEYKPTIIILRNKDDNYILDKLSAQNLAEELYYLQSLLIEKMTLNRMRSIENTINGYNR